MAVKKTKRKYIKTIHPNKTVLGLFKDIDTNSFMAFDESGNVEEVTSTPSLTITDLETITVDDIGSSQVVIENTISDVFTANAIEINAKIGYVDINLEDNEVTSGATLQVPINNSFVTANSIIFLTLENLNTSGSTNNNKGIILNVINKGAGVFTITFCSIWGINLNGATNYYEDSFRVNFIIF
jgi:hypothetical protein